MAILGHFYFGVTVLLEGMWAKSASCIIQGGGRVPLLLAIEFCRRLNSISRIFILQFDKSLIKNLEGRFYSPLILCYFLIGGIQPQPHPQPDVLVSRTTLLSVPLFLVSFFESDMFIHLLSRQEHPILICP